jgi:Concanavalin A-like lectin/glucanases superfamily/Bacterial Ig domain
MRHFHFPSGLKTLLSTASIMLAIAFLVCLLPLAANAQGGMSLSVDGQSWVKVTNNSTLDMLGSFTVEAWVKTTSTARQGIVERFNNAATTGSDGGYILRILKTGQVAFFTLQNANIVDEVISTSTVADNHWHHVAGVYNAGTGTLSIFVDGFPQGSTSGRAAPTGTSNLFIGTSADSAGFFTGLIDEVKLSNGALYSGNFTPLAHAIPASGTVGLWNFDDKTLNDSSGLGNNGVAKGTGILAFSTDVPTVTDAPPTVTITSPATGTLFTPAPATIPISATASDSDGTITKVDFFLNTSTLIATVNTSPYNTSVTLSMGTYTLTAVATDNGGATTTSNAVTVTVGDTPPTVSITSPGSGAMFHSGTPIPITATASDSDGTVTQVQFFANNNSIGTALNPPYSITWSNATPGSYALTAQATDNAGLTATSSPVNIIVQGTSPAVSLTAPTNGATYAATANITLYAFAGENGGAISQVQFFANGGQIGTATTVPYGITWSNVAAGSYMLTAKAIDTLGNSTISSPVNITVAVGGINSPGFQGFLDIASCSEVSGWAWDANQGASAINVDIFDGGSPLATTTANIMRQDLVTAGIGNGFHGFRIPAPTSLQDGRSHIISARFGGTTQSLSSSPKTVNCSPSNFPSTGTVNPKYVVLGVIYAPPGTDSHVDYTTTTMVGTSTSVSSSFTNSTSESVSLGVSDSIFGSITRTASTEFTQESDTSSSVAVNETTTDTTVAHGPAAPATGLNHELDQIMVWLNPVLNFEMTDPNTIISQGFTFDERDRPVMDVAFITLAQLRGTIDPGSDLAQRLQRNWAPDPLDGTGRGLTRADLDAILAADPFSKSDYTINILPGASCTSDNRFCFTGQAFDFSPPASGGEPNQNIFSMEHTTTQTQGQGGSQMFQVGFSLEEKSGSFLNPFTADLKSSNTLTWTNKWNTMSTQQVGQKAAATINGPPAGFLGTTQYGIYQDNVYGSFMFVPFPATTFAISLSAAGMPVTVIKVAHGSDATVTVSINGDPAFNSIVSLAASGLPPGATATFDKPTITGSGSTTLTIHTATSTPLGKSQITISGTAGQQTHSTAVTLKVQ